MASSKLLSDIWRRATSSISPDWTGLVATCSGSEASEVAVVYTGGIPGCRSRYTDHRDEDVKRWVVLVRRGVHGQALRKKRLGGRASLASITMCPLN
ncbi:unnamed protein product [Urochloa humidicola]